MSVQLNNFLAVSNRYVKSNATLKAEADRQAYKNTTKALKPQFTELLESCGRDLILFGKTLKKVVLLKGPEEAPDGQKAWSQKFLEKAFGTAKKYLEKNPKPKGSRTTKEIVTDKTFLSCVDALKSKFNALNPNPLYKEGRIGKREFKSTCMSIISSKKDVEAFTKIMQSNGFEKKAIDKFRYYSEKAKRDTKYGTKEWWLKAINSPLAKSEEKKQ